jgi:dienelactone hydrolase
MGTTGARTLTIRASLSLLASAAGFAAVAAQPTAATETAVTIPSDGYDISGTLALPADTEGAVPAVLLLHGYGSDKHEVGLMYTRLAEALAAEGIASLRIDFAGMGESQASMLEYTYESQIGDAAAALDWLMAQDSVDPDRVGIHGFSMGSLIGAHVAGTDPRVAAFGSWSGAIYDGEQFFYDETMLSDCEAAGGQVELDLGWRTIEHSCEFFSSMMASTALTDLAAYANPMLLVAGAEDTTVDPAVSQLAAESTASEDVTLQIIEGADHIYNVLTEDQSLAEQALSITADWFAQKL